MGYYSEKINKLINSVKTGDDFIIFDVDRTIINTTSWYHACICPNLLINENNIQKFLELNEMTYGKPNSMNQSVFRQKTLDLIEPKISNEFLKKISSLPNWKNYFQEDDYIDSLSFFAAGFYISHQLQIYNAAIKYLKFAIRYYGKSLRILFLSSGYEPFIKGVVSGILSQSLLEDINYEVLGSDIDFVNGFAYEGFHIDQFDKQVIAEKILSKGAKIRFLADDSEENLGLFDVVKDAGGTALLVNHIKNQKESKSWNDLCQLLSHNELKKMLQNEKSNYSLKINSSHKSELLDVISRYTNSIGITSLFCSDYYTGLESLINSFKEERNKCEFKNIMDRITFKEGNNIILRGDIYYYWLPPYIFADVRSVEDCYKDLINFSIKGLKILTYEKAFYKLNSFGDSEKVIIYTIIDHLLQAMLVYLNTIEAANLNILTSSKQELDFDIDLIVQEVSDLLYFYLANKNVQALAENLLTTIPVLELIKEFNKYTDFHKGMRELDNNISIFNSISSIVESSKMKKIDFIITFPYGGIALGYAFKSYLKLYYNNDCVPEIINCHFSSKKDLRKNDKKPNFSDKFWLMDFIPQKYSKHVEQIIKGENNLLLYDNNITTIKTLEQSKSYFEQFGNKVYSAVVSINYDNLCDYLLYNDKCEALSKNWNRILDFQPVEEYVTAFNTWNTSAKSKIFDQIYYPQDNIQRFLYQNENNVREGFIFKLCRVHNPFDLDVAVRNGANMIGIHAVNTNQLNYLINESKYKPIIKNFSVREDLPISSLEIDSIKAIQRCIPKAMKQAIIFEQEITPELMIECCEIYNMPRNQMFVQLQHRINETYINTIKNKVCKKVIAAIGLYQEDFQDYFRKLENMLDFQTDFILLDLSKHQPDLISSFNKDNLELDNLMILEELSPIMRNNRIPILLADDTTPDLMHKYINVLKSNNVSLAGIDMQNNVELKRNEQRYQIFNDGIKDYQGRIRKDPATLSKWSLFVNKYLVSEIVY
ncbi:hypothetical protein ACQVPI_22215 [Bacillus wiedmannii]|uniref:hypothetical protein n=1 Tax=Bacillus wiedmannii TaxID=1890302 RepID=UPI003D65D91A